MRGEVWWADLGAYRPREQTGRRPVVIWQSDTLTRALQSVLVVPLPRTSTAQTWPEPQ
jgi:mRNA-degrading endonuclease toxin of MazEF toxin-antitoxin module